MSVQVLLRELSRDVLEVLRAFAGSTSFPTIPAEQLQALDAASPLLGAINRVRALAPRSGAAEPAAAPAPDKSATVSLNSVPWDRTIAHALTPVRPLAAASLPTSLPAAGRSMKLWHLLPFPEKALTTPTVRDPFRLGGVWGEEDSLGSPLKPMHLKTAVWCPGGP